MQHRFIGRAVVLFAAVALLGACGGDKGVGTGLDNVDGQGGEGAIGQATTTTVAAVTTIAATATTKGATPTTVATPAVIFTINPDSAAGKHSIEPLQPPPVRINQLIRFTNVGADSPVIELTLNGAVAATSPVLGPNANFDTKLTRPGVYEVTDKSRPYATGIQLTVTG